MSEKQITAPFAGLKALPFDFDVLLESQRKNMQALSEIQTLVMDVAQVMARQQAEILSKSVQKNAQIIGEIWTQDTPEHKIAKYADFADKSYRQSVADCEEAAKLINQSGREATDIVSARISSTLTELKSAIRPKGIARNHKKAA